MSKGTLRRNVKNLTIGKKFSLACVALVLLGVVLGAVAVINVGSINTNLQSITQDSLPGVYRIGALQTTVQSIRGNFWKYLANSDASKKAQTEQANEALKQSFYDGLAAYEKTITKTEDRQQFEKIKPAFDQFIAAWGDVQSLDRQGKTTEAIAKYFATVDPAHKATTAVVQSLVDWNKTQGEKNAVTATSTVSQSRIWAISLLVAMILIGGTLSYVITKNVNKALTRAIAELTEGADQVASAAGQVASSSQALAQGSSEQAASLEETSASSEEINSMARKNTENSRSAADLVTASEQKFVETNQALEQTVSAMNDINEQSGKISKIIKTIDEIAFQTNILALNAAVEAARAGEAGMGFAVVADEVRNLAQRAAQAAKDTSSLIEESITKSGDGKEKVDQVAAAIQALTAESASIKTLVDEVNLGSQEQSRGIDQIVKAISQMEQVTQKNAAGAEEGASAAEQLTAQSETLKDVVARLDTMVGGSAASTRGLRTSSASRPALKLVVNKRAERPAPQAPRLTKPAAVAAGDFPLEDDFQQF
jgi:methyl-accepting chemotaxis protein/methyl-accepting chemotaxis protein-1 (serine sensor receptor)